MLKSFFSFFVTSKERLFIFLLGGAALFFGGLTYIALSNTEFFSISTTNLFFLLIIDFFILLCLVGVITKRLVVLWAEHKKGLAGSRLHIRFVVLFGLVTVIPSVLLAIFSAFFFHFGIEAWFNRQVKTALSESLAVAQSYLEEHKRSIISDIGLMSRDLNKEIPRLVDNPEEFNHYLTLMAVLRSLKEVIVFDEDRKVLARSNRTFTLELEPVPFEAVEKARKGEVPVLASENADKVRALIRIDGPTPFQGPYYLYVGRYVDPQVISRLAKVEGVVSEYDALERRQSSIQVTFMLIFGVVTLLLLLAAVGIGIMLASQLVRPIGRLIEAARQVGSGNLHVRLPEHKAIKLKYGLLSSKQNNNDDELSALSHAFNVMIEQLEQQQQQLKEASKQIERRQQFTESVLAGVTAGVIGLNSEGSIYLPNKSASFLLKRDLTQQIGTPIAEIFPEIQDLFLKAQAKQEDEENINMSVESEINFVSQGHTRTFLVRITRDQNKKGEVKGFVVTFDDMTEQLSDQRKAAWSDVARRIAHEIKNPLTPIQLSTERLRRKYLSQINQDQESYVRCLDTITRQVDTIRLLVAEFSSFARMPVPEIKKENLSHICEQAILLQKNAHADIKYELHMPRTPIYFDCDAGQITQALINLLQNAADAIYEREEEKNVDRANPDIIFLELKETKEAIVLQILDTGKGLPMAGRERLLEPYYTTRPKGTGLGLAIVKKIVQDHKGTITLKDREDAIGVQVTLYFLKN